MGQQNITFEMLEKMAMDYLKDAYANARAIESSKNIRKVSNFANAEFRLGQFFAMLDLLKQCDAERFFEFLEMTKVLEHETIDYIEKFYKLYK